MRYQHEIMHRVSLKPGHTRLCVHVHQLILSCIVLWVRAIVVRAIVVRAIVVRAIYIVTIIGGTAMKGRSHATWLGMSTMIITCSRRMEVSRGTNLKHLNEITKLHAHPHHTPIHSICPLTVLRYPVAGVRGTGMTNRRGQTWKMGKDHHSNISKNKN